MTTPKLTPSKPTHTTEPLVQSVSDHDASLIKGGWRPNQRLATNHNQTLRLR